MLGKSADPQFLSKLTYIAWKHEPNYVLGVDTVRAYSIANLYWVEVDILLPSKMKLKYSLICKLIINYFVERLMI